MRPDILNPLFAEVTALKGVGPQLAKPLERLGLARGGDVAFHLPSGYIDRLPREELDQADVGRTIAIQLTPVNYRMSGSARAPARVEATDARGNYVTLVFFGGNSGWAKKQLPLNEAKWVSGRLDQYGQELQIVHPEIVALSEPRPGGREAIYPLSEGMTSKRLADFAAQAVARAPELPEWIEPSVMERRGWPSWRDALHLVHRARPKEARDRPAHDELFPTALALMPVRADNRRRKGQALVGDGSYRGKLALPFPLTGAQKRSIAEIEGDLAQEAPMLRLLQGDVGAGKTVVALEAMLIAVEAGAQAALLAPTELLARQHFETLRRMAAPTGAEVVLFTGRDKGKARESILMGLLDGSIDIVVGTHAIFQDTVAYRNLAMVVIDEQHRFGVGQRLMLAGKGKRAPHVLAMTATPIPRTLTLAQYGELDVSKLDELPPGRQAIDTVVMGQDKLALLVDRLAAQIAEGRQAYWVCPMVRESDAERVESWIQEAVGAGARLIAGGGRDGAVVQPAILADVDRNMRFSRDELFGPAVGVTPVSGIDEAIEFANDTRFGLSAAIFTENLDNAMKFALEVDSGNLNINGGTQFRGLATHEPVSHADQAVSHVYRGGDSILGMDRLLAITELVVILNVIVDEGCLVKRLYRHCRATDRIRNVLNIRGPVAHRRVSPGESIVDGQGDKGTRVLPSPGEEVIGHRLGCRDRVQAGQALSIHVAQPGAPTQPWQDTFEFIRIEQVASTPDEVDKGTCLLEGTALPYMDHVVDPVIIHGGVPAVT